MIMIIMMIIITKQPSLLVDAVSVMPPRTGFRLKLVLAELMMRLGVVPTLVTGHPVVVVAIRPVLSDQADDEGD